MTVFRIHTRPKGGLGNAKISFAYCIKTGVLGLGWQTESQDNNATWNEYKNEAKEIYGEKELSRVKYLKNNVLKDDLIWARNTDGCYYLGKVDSEWEYFSDKDAQDADIVNIVRCNIKKIISIDDVPGKVIACFRPSRTIQAIRDNTAIEYSKYLWNKVSNTEHYDLPKEHFKNVFSFLDSEETEDVIFVYLQLQGWVVIPNSRKADTMSYEFYLIHRESKEKAIVQVKTGHTSLRASEWEGKNEKVFLFQSNNKYLGTTDNSNVITIAPSEIEVFMYNNKGLLPSNIVHWLELADSEKKT
jgi:hypothetical protein